MALKAAKIKRWMAFVITGILPLILFASVFVFYKNIWAGLGAGLGMALLMVVIGGMLTRSPFTKVFEDGQYLAQTIDSSGNIQLFNLVPMGSKIAGEVAGTKIEHAFDRDAIMYLGHPRVGSIGETADDYIIKLPKKDFNSAYFVMNGVPCFSFNLQLGTFLTKEMLSTLETKTFARHEILYLNQLSQSLNSHMLTFGRYVMELMKPMSSFLNSPWLKWLIVILVLAALGYILYPTITGAGAKAVGSAAAAATSAPAVVLK